MKNAKSFRVPKSKALRLLSLLLIGIFISKLSAQTTYREIEVKGGGTISGVVRLAGNLPPLEKFEVTKNPEHCGVFKPNDRLIIGKNRGVKNAVICLEGITEGKRFPANVKYSLDQRNCEYVPHVQIIPAGAQLQIVNSDNILHNVHVYEVGKELRTICNIAQPIKGQRTTIKQSQLSRACLAMTTCDAGYPWMTGSLIIIEHPYYVVTDGSGKFIFTEVPPGSYKVKMWHEGFRIVGEEKENGKVKRYHFEDTYEVVKDVTVSPNAKVTLDFDLVSRQSIN